jgi:ribosome maturation factor RimP
LEGAGNQDGTVSDTKYRHSEEMRTKLEGKVAQLEKDKVTLNHKITEQNHVIQAQEPAQNELKRLKH